VLVHVPDPHLVQGIDCTKIKLDPGGSVGGDIVRICMPHCHAVCIGCMGVLQGIGAGHAAVVDDIFRRLIPAGSIPLVEAAGSSSVYRDNGITCIKCNGVEFAASLLGDLYHNGGVLCV